VRRTNPGVVYCSISDFGSGPGADLPGYNVLVQAVGGLMSITGQAGGPPTKVGVALVDVLTSKDPVIEVLAALAARERDGHGQHIEVNLLSNLLAALVNQASADLWTGRAPVRLGNQHPSIAPYETLRCRDGLIAICCGNDGQFRRCVTVLGKPGLADDPRFTTNADRVAHRSDVIAELESPAGRRHRRLLDRTAHRSRVPAGKVGDLADAFALAERLGLAPTVPVGPIMFRRSGIRSATPAPPSPATVLLPAWGEHTEEIRRWFAPGRTSRLPHPARTASRA